MRELLTRFLDTLFPPSTHNQTLRVVEDEIFEKTFEPRLVDGVVVLSQYRNSQVQSAIHENKFHHSRRAAHLLGIHLQHHLQKRSDIALLPIPLGPKRERERGHNQVVSIVQAAGLETLLVTNVLARVRETQPQSRLKPSARIKNMENAFTLIQKPNTENIREVIILDDVMTSGATLKEARAALAPHLPPEVHVSLLAIAH